MIPFLDLAKAYAAHRDELDAAWHRVMQRGWFIAGDELAAFERELAAYTGARHAIGVANGLDALALVQEKERLAALNRALGGIRELCRILVRGRFLDDRSYEDLAAELERAPETLRVHLHRCLRVLREMLEMSDNR